MTVAELQDEIVDDLKIELQDDTDFNENLLEVKVKNAIREIRNRRGYPANFTEDRIVADLERLYSDIARLAVIDYNQVGAQGQSSHTEDDVKRSWESRENILCNITAYVKVL